MNQVKMNQVKMNSLLIVAGILAATMSQSAWSRSACAADLLHLVDGNAAACLHVRHLAGNLKRIEESRFAQRIRDTDLYASWLSSPEYRLLLNVGTGISTVSGHPTRQTVESIFGREFVVSVRFRADEEVTAALILRVDPATADEILTVWKHNIPTSPTPRVFHDVDYYSSPPFLNPRPMYYVQLKDVLALTNDETEIRRLIELSTRENPPKPLARIDNFAPAVQRRSEHELVSLFVNPRAFDEYIQTRDEIPLYARTAWNHCRWITLRGLLESRQLKFQLIADYDSQQSPEWWNRQVRLQGRRGLPLAMIPDSACLTLSGYIETGSVRDLMKQSARDEDSLPENIRQIRRVLAGLLHGADPLDDLLPRLGPRWLFYTVPRKAAESATFPLDGLVSIEFQLQGTRARRNQIKSGVENALQTGLNTLAAIHNAKTTEELSILHRRSSAGTTIHWAEPVTFFRPAFAVTDQQLIIATDPDVCDAFLSRENPSAGDRPTDPATFPTGNGIAHLAAENQLFLANSIATRKLLTTHNDWFIRQAMRENVSESDATQRLVELQDALSVIDKAWLSFSGTSKTLTGTVGVSIDTE